MKRKGFLLLFSITILLSACTKESTSPNLSNYSFSVSKGKGETTIADLYNCQGGRPTNLGSITSSDNKTWTVPAEVNFQTATKASDLYNDCSGVKLSGINDLDTADVPIITIDNDGEVITGYFFGDNYFELYVNGKLVAVDPVPYTPFNSCVVRFKAKRPFTYAVKLVDWEENPGLGTENNNGNSYYAGDGGFIASFSDGTITDAGWKAQTFYIAPIENLDLVKENDDGTRTTSSASTSPSCKGECYGVHFEMAADWFSPAFDDSKWPNATIYTEKTVGVDNKAAYTNFTSVFSGKGAQFIWSSNLVLDNVVLIRKTVN